MPMPNKLQKQAIERGEPLETLIPRLLDELGTMYAVAVDLGVYPNTILNWLNKNNYRYNTKKKAWMKKRTRKSPGPIEYQPLETVA